MQRAHLEYVGFRHAGTRFGPQNLLPRNPALRIHEIQPVRHDVAAQGPIPTPYQQLQTGAARLSNQGITESRNQGGQIREGEVVESVNSIFDTLQFAVTSWCP